MAATAAMTMAMTRAKARDGRAAAELSAHTPSKVERRPPIGSNLQVYFI